MGTLHVVDYLRGGGTYESLIVDHAVHAKPHNGKVSFVYDQIAARDEDKLAQQCRGLILREHTHEVVAYPFNRFFNHGQGAAADIDWGTARCEEKLDGTLLIVYWDDRANRWHCATRSMCEAHGNINGQQTFAALADACARTITRTNATLDDMMQGLCADAGVTYLFELTGPYNRVVCEYPGLGLTLLGARRLSDFVELEPTAIAQSLGFASPRTWGFANVTELVETIKDWSPLQYEGVIVKDAAFNRVKVKSPAYLAAHRATSSLGSSWRNVCEAILTGHVDDIYACVPPFVQDRIDSLRPAVARLAEQTERDYQDLRGIDDMKTFALSATQRAWSSPLFALKRGKTDSVGAFLAQTQPDTVLDLCRKLGWAEPPIAAIDMEATGG